MALLIRIVATSWIPPTIGVAACVPARCLTSRYPSGEQCFTAVIFTEAEKDGFDKAACQDNRGILCTVQDQTLEREEAKGPCGGAHPSFPVLARVGCHELEMRGSLKPSAHVRGLKQW